MELTNATALAARIDVGSPLPNGNRRGMLVAKATYRFDAVGRVTLDDQDPYPIFLSDVLTPQGTLPRDDMPRLDEAFEVCLLGWAHAGGKRHVRVSLSVGDASRAIDVFGDREWLGSGEGARISEPEPFDKMPLTWSRAFGGSAEVEVDEGSTVVVQNPLNPYGKGFDLAGEAAQVDGVLACPPGFPRFAARRPLPNLERPEQRIVRWSDSPEPVSWAPPPFESGVHNRRSFRVIEEEGQPPRAIPTAGVNHRAAPEWVLDAAPAPGTRIVLDNVTPEGRNELRLPSLDVHFDFVLDGRTGSRRMKKQALVLLPEERRFYVVYRLPFEIDPPNGSERGARLRLQPEGLSQ